MLHISGVSGKRRSLDDTSIGLTTRAKVRNGLSGGDWRKSRTIFSPLKSVVMRSPAKNAIDRPFLVPIPFSVFPFLKTLLFFPPSSPLQALTRRRTPSSHSSYNNNTFSFLELDLTKNKLGIPFPDYLPKQNFPNSITL